MTLQLLPTRSDSRPALDLAPGLRLALARVHEACGPARRTFAMWLAGRMTGPVIWIAPGWATGGLNPDGVRRFVDPGRLIFVTPHREIDLLWCMEEALRAGAVPLVVADLPAPPALTPVRRLQLAAEAGGSAALGLILTPGAGGAPGVESRWRMEPEHGVEGATAWRLERLRARMAPERSWRVAAEKGSFGIVDRAAAPA